MEIIFRIIYLSLGYFLPQKPAVVDATRAAFCLFQNDSSIKAMFVDLNFASSYDYVVVNAGASRTSPTFGRYAQGSPLGEVYFSRGNLFKSARGAEVNIFAE